MATPSWPTIGFHDRVSFTRGHATASPSNTQGGSRMRESRPYGSVRGAPSNGCPYRDRKPCSGAPPERASCPCIKRRFSTRRPCWGHAIERGVTRVGQDRAVGPCPSRHPAWCEIRDLCAASLRLRGRSPVRRALKDVPGAQASPQRRGLMRLRTRPHLRQYSRRHTGSSSYCRLQAI